MSDPPPLRRTATVVWLRGHVFDPGDFDASVLDRSDRGLSTGARALAPDFDSAHAVLHRATRAGLRGHLRRERCRLTRTLEADVAGRRPREGVAFLVGDGHDRVVE